MISRQYLSVCATLVCFCLAVLLSQGTNAQIPRTKFTCRGRPSGYYADVETGCQVYHMCDEIGRQFSYSCPNTTLFQQRMLICDHWYMVDCRKSEQDYDANLLIGQRDKPFVSDAEMQFRTPRPDILAVPPNNNYYDGLKEAESKYPVHPGNSIVGIPDTISKNNNNGLDSEKNQYHPPTGWSSGTENRRPTTNNHFQTPTSNTPTDQLPDNLAGAASQKPLPSFETAPDNAGFTTNTQTTNVPNNQPLTAPDRDLSPPLPPITTTPEPSSDGADQLDIRMDSREDPVVDFIKRFDPNSPDSHKTAMTTSEILNINQQLPQGHDVSGEEERTPRKQKNNGNNFNTLQTDGNKGVTTQSRFNSVNTKNDNFSPSFNDQNIEQRSGEPSRSLLPPKTEFSNLITTTVGPPIYYNWKWAVPAFDLEPPTASNETHNVSEVPQARSVQDGRNPFADWSTTTTTEASLKTWNTEYNISSYYVPDYLFPLDKHHPGYGGEDAQTSFNVKLDKSGKTSFGENPACPQCHPAYVVPGTCEPCVVQR